MASLTASRPTRTALTVWLDPGPGVAPAAVVEALREVAHLVVVPRTGSRRADVAVLLAPVPAVLELVRRLLPGAVLVGLPGGPPSAALVAAARRERAVLLPPDTGAASLRSAVLHATERPAAV